jgi:hypothetical protein
LIASGIDRFDLWRSVDGRPATLIASTRATSLVVHVRRRTQYSFYTIAVDRAGNRQPPPAPPLATTRVLRRRR